MNLALQKAWTDTNTRQETTWDSKDYRSQSINLQSKKGTVGSIVTSKHKKIYFIGQWGYEIEYWKHYIREQRGFFDQK